MLINEIYSADFECTTAAYSPDFSMVWKGGFVNIKDWDKDDKVTLFDSIEDFMWYLEFFFKNHDILYFHNLKYDGSFIINQLFKENYTAVKNIDKVPAGKCFDTAINDMGVWYRIRIRVPSQREGFFKTIEIRNSLCLVAGSVASIGDSFGTRKRKLDIDYDEASFPHKLTKEEEEYIKADVQIMAEVLNILINEYGFTRLTAGSNAMYDFMQRFGGGKAKGKFRDVFPILSSEIDEFCREAYRGGISWVNPKFKGKELGEGVTYDCNSEYPGMMHGQSGHYFPYGEPEWFDGMYHTDRKYPLWIARIGFVAHRKPDKMPCMQIKRSNQFKENEWLDHIEDENGGPVYITITSADYELMHECYDIDAECWEGGYKFKGCRGVFDIFIDHWNEIKMTSKGAKRQVAKLMMNSFYGKFGTRLSGKSKDVSWEDGKLKFTITEPEEREGFYLPVACFVTAYGRQNLVRAGNANFDRLVYVDTDSLHLLGWDEAKNIEIHQKKLGAWKMESKWCRGKFIRQKTYVEDIVWPEKSGLDIKCAGMPDSIKYNKYVGDDGMVHKMPAITFEQFAEGARWETGKLIGHQVKGGVLLLDTPFEIKPH